MSTKQSAVARLPYKEEDTVTEDAISNGGSYPSASVRETRSDVDFFRREEGRGGHGTKKIETFFSLTDGNCE
jgi:hypothetical protein